MEKVLISWGHGNDNGEGCFSWNQDRNHGESYSYVD